MRGTHQCLHVAAVVIVLPPLLQERPHLGLAPLREIGANRRRNRSKGVTLRKAKGGSNKGESYDKAVQQRSQCVGSVESLIEQRQQAAAAGSTVPATHCDGVIFVQRRLLPRLPHLGPLLLPAGRGQRA